MDDDGSHRKRQKIDSILSDLSEELAKEREDLDKERRNLKNDRRELDAEKEASRKELLAGREKLEAEKEAMMKSGVTDSDILELNVGGEMFMVQRGTLLLAPEDSHLHAMFSGRWEESLSRNKEGTIFLDMSPHVFRSILSRLRGSKLKAKPPIWEDMKTNDPTFQYELEAVLQFFGLVHPIPSILMKSSTHGGIDVVDGRVLTRNNDGPSYRPAISSEEISVGTVWKIHINSLHSGSNRKHWIFAGIIGASMTPSRISCLNRTSYGWSTPTPASGETVWVNGKSNNGIDGWVGWEADDVAIFKLESNSLKMYHTRLQCTFKLQLPVGSHWKVHLNMCNAGDKVEVLVPTKEEISILN